MFLIAAAWSWSCWPSWAWRRLRATGPTRGEPGAADVAGAARAGAGARPAHQACSRCATWCSACPAWCSWRPGHRPPDPLSGRWPRGVAALLVLPAVGALVRQYFDPRLARDDYRGLVADDQRRGAADATRSCSRRRTRSRSSPTTTAARCHWSACPRSGRSIATTRCAASQAHQERVPARLAGRLGDEGGRPAGVIAELARPERLPGHPPVVWLGPAGADWLCERARRPSSVDVAARQWRGAGGLPACRVGRSQPGDTLA